MISHLAILCFDELVFLFLFYLEVFLNTL